MIENIFELDMILMPANSRNVHWFLVAIQMKERKLFYCDSLHGDRRKYLKAINQSLIDEAIYRERFDLLTEDKLQFKHPFTLEKYPSDKMPTQTNSYDCGVFVIMMINFIIDNIPLENLKQRDMATYRINLACDIIRQHFNYSNY